MKARYALNRRTRVMHRYPTLEACNWDQVPRRRRKYFRNLKAAAGEYELFCLHCLKRQTSST